MLSILKSIILGRENGFRRSLARKILKTEPTDSSTYTTPETNPIGTASSVKPVKEPPTDVTPPEGFSVALHKDALKSGEIKEVILAGQAVVIANVDDQFFAVSGTCPHAGAPLAEGFLRGTVLTCPYHGWTFDVVNGACQTNPDSKLSTFEVCIEGKALCVRT